MEKQRETRGKREGREKKKREARANRVKIGGMGMIGRLCWEELGRFKVKDKKIYLHALPFYQISMESKGRLLPLRLKYANMLFAEEKIHRVLTPPHFDLWEYLPNLRPYDPLPVLQSLGGDILLHRMTQCSIPPEKATVTLVGQRVTKAMEQVAFTLVPQVKELVLLVEDGREELGERIFQKWGLAPCSSQKHSSATLYFTSPTSVKTTPKISSPSPLSLQLHREDSPDFQGISIKNKTIPSDIPPQRLLALLLQTEKVQKKDILFS